jgi:hypothetical protein
MGQLQPKQVKKILSGFIKITGLSVGASASSIVVTSQLTSALTVAGDGSTAVPLVASSSQSDNGVAITNSGNKCEIFDNGTKQKLTASGGSEIYGRITFASSAYTLTFYYLDNSGIETGYTFLANSTIDFDFLYRFRFHEFPSDAMVSIISKNVYQDSKGSDSVEITEILAVTATNTLANLSSIPAFPTKTKLFINGKTEVPVGVSPPFTISTNTITWNQTNAGYVLETTDYVAVTYYI